MSLDITEMKSYLKEALDLESSIYALELMKERLKHDLVLKTPRKKAIVEPKRKEYKEPTKPLTEEISNDVIKDRNLGYAFLFFSVFTFIAAIVIGALAVSAWNDAQLFTGSASEIMMGSFKGSMTGCCIFALASVVTLVLGIKKVKMFKEKRDSEAKERMDKYNRELIDYQEKTRIEDERFNSEMAKYRKQKKDQEKNYNTEYAIAEYNYDQAKKMVKKFDKPLREAKELLDKIYALDYIFPKYRNLIAVCTIYEYFMTGRVSTLEGPDGAYNLYEAELRQNLIINRLDTIIDQLEQIKQNQFTLYQEIEKTNAILTDVSKDIKVILSTTAKIESNTELTAKATRMTAYYTQVVAQNTEAIKYLSLVNG